MVPYRKKIILHKQNFLKAVSLQFIFSKTQSHYKSIIGNFMPLYLTVSLYPAHAHPLMFRRKWSHETIVRYDVEMMDKSDK